MTAFLVDSNLPGVEPCNKIEKVGVRTASFSEVFLDNVYVSKQAVLGGAGAGTTIFTHSMDCDRTLLFAYHVGAMERLLETPVEFARTRHQFGKPISQFPAIKIHAADMKMNLEAPPAC